MTWKAGPEVHADPPLAATRRSGRETRTPRNARPGAGGALIVPIGAGRVCVSGGRSGAPDRRLLRVGTERPKRLAGRRAAQHPWAGLRASVLAVIGVSALVR